ATTATTTTTGKKDALAPIVLKKTILSPTKKTKGTKEQKPEPEDITVESLGDNDNDTDSYNGTEIELLEDKAAVVSKKRSDADERTKSKTSIDSRRSNTPSKNDMNVKKKIKNWMSQHKLWWNDKTGMDLMCAIVDAGIDEPDTQLPILKEWPDLIQIAEQAKLNIMQRREFIYAAQNNINLSELLLFHSVQNNLNLSVYTSPKQGHVSGKSGTMMYDKSDSGGDNGVSGTLNLGSASKSSNDRETRSRMYGSDERKWSRHTLKSYTKNEGKVILVMSREEQEALSKIESIVQQLHVTRYLIRQRCIALEEGRKKSEKVINEEFAHLKQMLEEREQMLLQAMRIKTTHKMKQLKVIDKIAKAAVIQCNKAKENVEYVIANDTRFAGNDWAVLSARKKRAVDLLENCIDEEIGKYESLRPALEKIMAAEAESSTVDMTQMKSLACLIHTDVDMENILEFEPFDRYFMTPAVVTQNNNNENNNNGSNSNENNSNNNDNEKTNLTKEFNQLLLQRLRSYNDEELFYGFETEYEYHDDKISNGKGHDNKKNKSKSKKGKTKNKGNNGQKDTNENDPDKSLTLMEGIQRNPSQLYGSHRLNVFIRSLEQIKLRLSLPGFGLKRNKAKIEK
ncbi:NOL1/NOP2/Sun family protein, partial [Reticulomyxa filosa]